MSGTTKTVSLPNVDRSRVKRVTSAASTNATSVVANPASVDSVNFYNAAAYAVFVKLFDKASAPTVGTDVPKAVFGIKAGERIDAAFPKGLQFDTGLAFSVTKLAADSDTTAVAAADVEGFIAYR